MSEQRLDVEFWNRKAKPCSNYERRSSYADEFIKLSGILPGETVLDMACGSGTLCLPLADDGHRVFCADFSPNMIQSVRDVIEEEQIELLETRVVAWEDDWEAMGVPVCDLAFGSRALFNTDPELAVKKLSSHARRRACISVAIHAGMFKNGYSPYNLGEEADVTAYAERCIRAVRSAGYEPECIHMKCGKKDMEFIWLFIGWNV